MNVNQEIRHTKATTTLPYKLWQNIMCETFFANVLTYHSTLCNTDYCWQ